MSKKRKRHTAEQVVKKLRDADAMLAPGKSVGEVLQSLEVSEATLSRWRSQYGGMKSEEFVIVQKIHGSCSSCSLSCRPW
jgi:transposase-like protein